MLADVRANSTAIIYAKVSGYMKQFSSIAATGFKLGRSSP